MSAAHRAVPAVGRHGSRAGGLPPCEVTKNGTSCPAPADRRRNRSCPTWNARWPRPRPTRSRTTSRRRTPSTCSTRPTTCCPWPRRRPAPCTSTPSPSSRAASRPPSPPRRWTRRSLAEDGDARRAQRLRHRRPGPHGRRHARCCRRQRRLRGSADPADRADRRRRHPRHRRRHQQDQGSGRRRLQLRPGPLHPRRARRGAADQHDEDARARWARRTSKPSRCSATRRSNRTARSS